LRSITTIKNLQDNYERIEGSQVKVYPNYVRWNAYVKNTYIFVETSELSREFLEGRKKEITNEEENKDSIRSG
jgi:hypothetical protein